MKLSDQAKVILKSKLGTKRNPVNIYVVQAYFVYCPRCESTIDCGEDDKKITCPECNRKFFVEFNSMVCGL